jgi:hypothetical protein
MEGEAGETRGAIHSISEEHPDLSNIWIKTVQMDWIEKK